MRAPGFWFRPAGREAALLAPLAAIYGVVAGRRMDRAGRPRAAIPVICVGNFTLGGGGKTPTALALAAAARGLGRRPGFLTRGHGGRSRAALLVDPARHDAALVGDEALLLAAAAPTAATRDRAAGARLLQAAGCDLAVMVDGFQSARLHLDLALVVVDGTRGLGNGRVFPAGPLRAPLAVQLRHCDAILAIGEGPGADVARALAARAGATFVRGRAEVPNAAAFAGRRVLAFAGIADPDRFGRSLEAAGAAVVGFHAFPDHHPFTADEARALLGEADSLGVTLATTAKDRARLGAAADGPVAALARRSLVLDYEIRFAEADLDALIRRALAPFDERSA